MSAGTGKGSKAFKLENVWFAYQNDPILIDVNLQIDRRDFACVVGPNGGGKTTLLKLLMGLLKPGRGSIEVLGTVPIKARPMIGYVPQYVSHDMLFPVTVMDVVLMGRLDRSLPLGRYRQIDRDQARTALDEVGLLELMKRPYSALSGGQRQRVLIARALVSEPGILLLDEPLSNVDAIREKELMELLKSLSERMTIVMVTHDLGFVSNYVSKVICVNRKVFVHPTAEMTGDLVQMMYDHSVRMIQHDHRLDPESSS